MEDNNPDEFIETLSSFQLEEPSDLVDALSSFQVEDTDPPFSSDISSLLFNCLVWILFLPVVYLRSCYVCFLQW